MSLLSCCRRKRGGQVTVPGGEERVTEGHGGKEYGEEGSMLFSNSSTIIRSFTRSEQNSESV